jgi:hypothetical protein
MSKLSKADLIQFTGTSQYYKHLTGLLYTDGVKFMAEAGAYWLIDAIASYQHKVMNTPRLREFQLWQLVVVNNMAILTCRADSGLPAVVTQYIEYTDFPFDIDLYVCNNVLLLPSEY